MDSMEVVKEEYGEEEEEEKRCSSPKVETSCVPHYVSSAAQYLSPEEKLDVERLNFGSLLNIELDTLGKGEIVKWLLKRSKVETDKISINIVMSQVLGQLLDSSVKMMSTKNTRSCAPS
uniref:Uncharacterized protein n=1 Tax=Oryza punctata TaxID=4537 RepID=A0A0E0LA56_ORYPU